jgi:hypothetical protein
MLDELDCCISDSSTARNKGQAVNNKEKLMKVERKSDDRKRVNVSLTKPVASREL